MGTTNDEGSGARGVLDRIPRVVQFAAALVTLGGAVFTLSSTGLIGGPEPSPTSSPMAFPGTRDTILSETPRVPPVALLTDIRVESHANFDRVVFEFRDNSPGYRVEYVTAPTEEFSGRPLEIEGEAYLQVRMLGAEANEGGNSTLEERSRDPDLPSIQEVLITGDAGGQVTAVLGLVQPLDYRVSRDVSPFRVIVDVAHPG